MITWLRRLAGEPVPDTRLPAGVVVLRCGWIPSLGGRLCGMGGPAAAVTLGSTIVVHPAVPLDDRLLRHELAHVRQWRARPLAFPVLYLARHIRHGYRNNPYEVEARAAERPGFGAEGRGDER